MTKSHGLWRWLGWTLLAALLLFGSFYLDGVVQTWMTHHQSAAGLSIMRAVSRWGDWPEHVLCAFIGAVIAYALGSRRWIMIFVAMVIACALAGSVNRVVKVAAGRARPTVTKDVGFNGPRFTSKYHAFPSGHTAASTAFFATLLLARRRVGLALLPIPLLIAWSRLYLNAHHFSDVIGGALLGIFCALLSWRFLVTHMLDTRPRSQTRLV